MNGNIGIRRKVLAILLFAAVVGNHQDWIDGMNEHSDVVIDVILADLVVSVQDVVGKVRMLMLLRPFLGLLSST